MTPEAPPLEAIGLGRRYRRTWGLRDCTLTIPAGRVVALVGPNGAGKTTLLHLATGLLAPSAGRIGIFGASPRGTPQRVLPRVGFMPQDVPLYRSFTVADTLAFAHRLNPRWDMPYARRRLLRLDIGLDRHVGALSAGQRAQVALTLALAKRAELLLLDEPTASLDPLARRELLQGLLDAVVAEGISVVLSSHVLAELERCCDYLVILANGRALLVGDIEQLRDTHRLLVGPAELAEKLAGHSQIIKEARTPRLATIIARTDSALPGPGWDVRQVGLEELVLAYLEQAQARKRPDTLAPAPSTPSTEDGS
jgi:ABC-2 type transport system ATP-binding protein